MHRINLSSGTPWETIVGYSRAVRIGDRVHVTGTTATTASGGHVGDGDACATMIEVSRFIADWMLVEIEADAVVGATTVEHRDW